MLDKGGKTSLYVSLFGLNSRKDIIQEINNRIIQETQKKTNSNLIKSELFSIKMNIMRQLESDTKDGLVF